MPMVRAVSSSVGLLLSATTLAALDPFARTTGGSSAAFPACDDSLTERLFADGDLGFARAELAVYKDAPKELRDCAVRVWQRGVAKLSSGEKSRLLAVPESRVHRRLGGTACVARVEDGSWLNIPRIQEILVCPEIQGKPLILEQDGFLRPFDMATVLWPAGFFLSLWVADNCNYFVKKNTIELGAGLGAPSIVAASWCRGEQALVTDKESYGLLNARANAAINGADQVLDTLKLDWNSDEDVAAAAARGPFDVVLGAGLAPHRWAHGGREWRMLAELVRPGSGRVILCHGAGDVDPEAAGLRSGGFSPLRLLDVVPGDRYGLTTRWGQASEFELLVLQRKLPAETPNPEL